MKVCGWCGKTLVGEGVYYLIRGVTWGNGKVEIEMGEHIELSFCCGGCHWAYQMDFHRLIGLSGKEARAHLTLEHEIASSKVGGRQSADAWQRSYLLGKVLFEGSSSYGFYHN